MTVVIVTVVTVAVVTVVIVRSFSKNNLTPRQQMRCSRCSFSRFSRCFLLNRKSPAHIQIFDVQYILLTQIGSNIGCSLARVFPTCKVGANEQTFIVKMYTLHNPTLLTINFRPQKFTWRFLTLFRIKFLFITNNF